MARPLRPPLVLADVIYFIVCLPQTASAFFFSSRRRHTILNCDWSSDVCSSDLNCHGSALDCSLSVVASLSGKLELIRLFAKRSQERRVGKECRCRWSSHH